MIKAYPSISAFLFHEDSALLPGAEFIHLQVAKLKYLKNYILTNMFNLCFIYVENIYESKSE